MAETDLSKASTDDLEKKLEEVETELEMLARPTLRSGVGNIGWLSATKKNSTHPEWAEIQLSESRQFDQIVLAPVLWIDAEKGPQADGFPTAFKVIAGDDGDTEGRVIAEMGPDDQFLPRVAPLVINVSPTTASWVRIVATQLVPHRRGILRKFKLSEIMLFSGQQNIALHQPVRVSSTVAGWGKAAIYKGALTDGLTPYLMDASGGRRSNAFKASSSRATPFTMTIDLGQSQQVDGIRLHSAFIDEYIPQINAPDFGMPSQFKVKGSNKEDFSDSIILTNYHRKSIYQSGNIIELRFTKADCRYIQLSTDRNMWPLDTTKTRRIISIGEIEVLAAGHNVAKNKTVHLPNNPHLKLSQVDALTDGLNNFGEILSIREWMEQLARRHELEIQQPKIAQILNQKYLQQKSNLRLMYWLAASLAVGIIFTILVDRVLRLRAVLKVRERVAANLHDELSASLHSMVLLGDMAKKHIKSPEKLTEVIDYMQQVSKRSRIAARHCANMLLSDNLCENLAKEMRFSADRLLADIPHQISIEGESLLQQLPRRKRNDLFLFHQECLTNIARHAEATSCNIHLTVSCSEIRLVVTDNGLGITETPPSLLRRARLLKAHITIDTPANGGTRITLTYKPRKGLLQPLS